MCHFLWPVLLCCSRRALLKQVHSRSTLIWNSAFHCRSTWTSPPLNVHLITLLRFHVTCERQHKHVEQWRETVPQWRNYKDGARRLFREVGIHVPTTWCHNPEQNNLIFMAVNLNFHSKWTLQDVLGKHPSFDFILESKPTTSTRWFKYDRDRWCVNKSQFVPVIFEPPCMYKVIIAFSLFNVLHVLNIRP